MTAPEKTETTGRGLTLQVGDTADDFQKVELNIKDMSTEGLGIADITIGTIDDATAAQMDSKNLKFFFVKLLEKLEDTLRNLVRLCKHSLSRLPINLRLADFSMRLKAQQVTEPYKLSANHIFFAWF